MPKKASNNANANGKANNAAANGKNAINAFGNVNGPIMMSNNSKNGQVANTAGVANGNAMNLFGNVGNAKPNNNISKPQSQQARPQGAAQVHAQSQAQAQVKKQKKAAVHGDDTNASNRNDKNANARRDNAPARYKALIDFYKTYTENIEMMECIKGCSVYAVVCMCPLVTKGHITASSDMKKFCEEASKVLDPLTSEKTLFMVPQHATIEDVYACLSTMHMAHVPNANVQVTYNDVGGGKVRKQLIHRFDQVFQDAGDKPRNFIAHEINGKKK
jgi:hypothetical protein